MNDNKIEIRSRWGNTDTYHEHEQKIKNYTKLHRLDGADHSARG